MDFKSKTVEDFLTWLENKGYDEWIREVFEGSFPRLFLFHRKRSERLRQASI